MTAGTFSGGEGTITVTNTIKKSDTGSGGWSNATSGLTYELKAGDDGKFFRATSRATDEAEQSLNSNSSVVGPVTTPVPPTTIGDVTATVNDLEYDLDTAPALTVLMNDPMPVAVTISGDADATYKWASRSEYPLLVSEQASSIILTLPQAGQCTVTCEIKDTNASDSPKSLIFNFWVVDAKTWAELQAKAE